MQRHEPEGVVLLCDFCGTEWDQVRPMIEGHHGSILCLECLKLALIDIKPATQKFQCSLCLQEQEPSTPRWTHPQPSAGANARAAMCDACMRQAAKAFDRDPDVEWKWERAK